jgi:regulator of cell morphogenesis and NO signaling
MTQAAMPQPADIAFRPEEWQDRTLADLIRYIVSRHHAYLRAELPAIDRLLASPAIDNSDARAGERSTLTNIFRQFRRGIEEHLKKEEAVLFPMIEKVETARQAGQELPRFPFGSIAHPISVMEQEHQRARQELAQMRTLTTGYTTLPGLSDGQSAVLRKLKDIESDLEVHSRLEDEVLFPRAIGLEG